MSSRSSVKIMPGAVVCSECELKGDIKIGARTVIHPRARIIAESGPIIIGEYNLIEEQCEIINRHTAESKWSSDHIMIIGNTNVFEVGSKCYSMHVGDNNVFEAKSLIGRDAEITSGCTIGAMCELTDPELLDDNTVIYGKDCHRRVAGEKPSAQTLQLDFLMKTLPNYHHIHKATKRANKVSNN